MAAYVLPPPIESEWIRTLDARCCSAPELVVMIETRIFSKKHRIICQHCLQELRVKREVFLAP